MDPLDASRHVNKQVGIDLAPPVIMREPARLSRASTDARSAERAGGYNRSGWPGLASQGEVDRARSEKPGPQLGSTSVPATSRRSGCSPFSSLWYESSCELQTRDTCR